MKIGLSGLKGSFSEEAAIDYAQKAGIENPELVYLLDMEGVLAALNEGEIDRGVFPVVNSIGGLVETAFEAMGRHTFEMLNINPFQVNQCLMVKPGISKADIQQVASHPQALSQCANYLNQEFPNAERVKWSDTAAAAKDLAEGNLPENTAVLAPARSAEVHGLELLEKGVQDRDPNLTTFIAVQNPN